MCFPDACDLRSFVPHGATPAPREGPQHAHCERDAPFLPGCGPGNRSLHMNGQVKTALGGDGSHLDPEPIGHTQVPTPGVPVGAVQTAPCSLQRSQMQPRGRLEAESEAGQGLLLHGRPLSSPEAGAQEGGALGAPLSTSIELDQYKKSGRWPYLPPRASLEGLKWFLLA